MTKAPWSRHRGRRRRQAALGADDVLARLGSGTGGLPEEEAARRVQVVGPNAVRSHRCMRYRCRPACCVPRC
ncbi:MAG: cation-transporting P-type ATPase [Streptosporangiaceae bacterium]